MQFNHALGTITFVQTPDELAAFHDFIRRGHRVLGLDTETTGLDIYTPGFDVRLVQIGNRDTAFVFDANRYADFLGLFLRDASKRRQHFAAHNAQFDLLAMDRVGIIDYEDLAPLTFDTYIFAHLLDPRSKRDGGIGLGLKDLSVVYVDEDAPDGEKALHDVFRKEYKANKNTGWAIIDLDHPTYLIYAGLDPILVIRLFDEIAPMVESAGLNNLSIFEHALDQIIAKMKRRGVRVDVPYTHDLVTSLAEEEAHYKSVAARYGVANINSTKQVAEALVAMGESLTELTPSGALKVDKGVLLPLADLSPDDWTVHGTRPPNALADAVLRAGRASKWSTSYAKAFLDLRDADDRIHPDIRALQARTARMSVSKPPLQQLPSSDWTIRRAIIADEGMTIAAADYAQVEMRVLAALSGEPKMVEAIAAGVDIHDNTATTMYGPNFTKAQRKIAKNTGFGEVFGGGAETLARQAGVDIAVAREAKRLFAEGFPGIKRYGRRLSERAEWGRKEVVTPSGRHLPLDRDRLYAATNYIVQSTARDILADAIMRLDEKGLTEYVLMPVHDEIVAQASHDDIKDVIEEIRSTMEVESFFGVPIQAEAEVYGPSWGHGYGAPEGV